MQETYSAVPLSTVSNWLKVNVDALHAFIEEMVAEGALNADIDLNGDEPVLRFYSNQSKGPLAKTEKQYHEELLAQTKKTNAMADYVKMSDRRLTLSKEYIDALRRRMRNKDENGMAVSGEPLDESSQLDEDIMMDE
jgi:COP9 signalosome complex subunit 3